MEENDNKLFECDNPSRLRFKEFLFKNNYALSVELLNSTDYLDVMFIDKNNKEHYCELKERKLEYITRSDLYLEEKKYRNLHRIAGLNGYIVNFFGDDLKHMMIHNYHQYKDAKLEYATATKFTVKESDNELKEVRCIEAKKGSFFIYDDNINNYIKVDYETFIK